MVKQLQSCLLGHVRACARAYEYDKQAYDKRIMQLYANWN